MQNIEPIKSLYVSNLDMHVTSAMTFCRARSNGTAVYSFAEYDNNEYAIDWYECTK